VILESYPENVEALGGWLCSSSRKPGSDSCVQLYQLTLCIITHLQILYWIEILLSSLVFMHSSKETNWFVRCCGLNYPKRYLCGTMLEEKKDNAVVFLKSDKLFGRYSSSWFIKTRSFGDCSQSPSSGKKHTYSVGPSWQSRCVYLPEDGDRFQSPKRRVLINRDDG
jgi:hypothetical protein